jgi:hypothetical protein
MISCGWPHEPRGNIGAHLSERQSRGATTSVEPCGGTGVTSLGGGAATSLSHVAVHESASWGGRAKGFAMGLSLMAAREPVSQGGGAKGATMGLSHLVAHESASQGVEPREPLTW